jgi:hypothetical protein
MTTRIGVQRTCLKWKMEHNKCELEVPVQALCDDGAR